MTKIKAAPRKKGCARLDTCIAKKYAPRKPGRLSKSKQTELTEEAKKDALAKYDLETANQLADKDAVEGLFEELVHVEGAPVVEATVELTLNDQHWHDVPGVVKIQSVAPDPPADAT